mmetsp:Transcript_28942/g.46618  ORF Transcript_28942/g.46618 Transcript_28942/m.46618 type:complete len:209 (-) Transcript_28942:365-991(-)
MPLILINPSTPSILKASSACFAKSASRCSFLSNSFSCFTVSRTSLRASSNVFVCARMLVFDCSKYSMDCCRACASRVASSRSLFKKADSFAKWSWSHRNMTFSRTMPWCSSFSSFICRCDAANCCLRFSRSWPILSHSTRSLAVSRSSKRQASSKRDSSSSSSSTSRRREFMITLSASTSTSKCSTGGASCRGGDGNSRLDLCPKSGL